MLLLMAITAAEAACPDVKARVAAAEQAVIEGRLEAAKEALEQAEAGLSCGPPVGREVIVQFWLTEGAVLDLQRTRTEAEISFAAAARIAPGQWNDDFGPQLQQSWRDAGSVTPGRGTIEFEGLPKGYQTFLDGERARFPAQTHDGLHLVQVAEGDEARWGSLVYLQANDTLTLRPGLAGTSSPPEPQPLADAPSAPEPAPATTPARRKDKRSPWLLVGSAVTALGAGTTAFVAMQQDDDIESAGTTGALDDAYGTQRLYGYTSYGLMGLTAVGVGLHFAL